MSIGFQDKDKSEATLEARYNNHFARLPTASGA